LVLVDRSSVNDLVHQVESASSLISANIGWGLWVVAAGAAVAIVAGFVLRNGGGGSPSLNALTEQTALSFAAVASGSTPSEYVGEVRYDVTGWPQDEKARFIRALDEAKIQFAENDAGQIRVRAKAAAMADSLIAHMKFPAAPRSEHPPVQ
jgi:hypothetical protein